MNIMNKSIVYFFICLIGIFGFDKAIAQENILLNKSIKVGAEHFIDNPEMISFLKNKRVAVVGNHTSMVNNVHLVDTLISIGTEVVKVFSPEHGFRGKVQAGEKINSSKDQKTGLPIVSLYGKNKKPSLEQLHDVDVVIFDIQDVGVRFYTYISTMHYVMEACAEQSKQIIILDRPNPNGFYVDGPTLKEGYTSFVGMHPIPVVHGLTIGELAKMIKEEQWINKASMLSLTVVPCKNYDHSDLYELPVAPSPNLPNMASVYLYPSLCFFEGTQVSIGRGTDMPFQVIGAPYMDPSLFNFTPAPNEGSKKPKFDGKQCFGYNLKSFGENDIKELKGLYLHWLHAFYKLSDKSIFFNKNNFIDLLYGSDELRNLIESGAKVAEITRSWKSDITEFKQLRKKYLLYPDFEN